MSEVAYFPRYSQPENFHTNNTLLLMHRIYDWNRHRFHKFLISLIGEQAASPIGSLGLQIRQQVGTGASVLDGSLHQASFRIGIEAKAATAEFNEGQLVRHLEGFEAGGDGFLLLLRPNKQNLEDGSLLGLKQAASAKGVVVASVTFEDIIQCARACLKSHDEDMHDLVDDFEAYCSEERLLNTDSSSIVVVPTGRSYAINVHNSLYFCPAERSHRTVAFMGLYQNKAVRKIGLIRRTVVCEVEEEFRARNLSGEVTHLEEPEKNRIRAAIVAAQQQNGWDLKRDCKWFLLENLVDVNFLKKSSGGIQGHRYFDLRALGVSIPVDIATNAQGIAQVAEALSQKEWE